MNEAEGMLVRSNWNKGLDRKFVEGVAEVSINRHHRAIAKALLVAWDHIDKMEKHVDGLYDKGVRDEQAVEAIKRKLKGVRFNHKEQLAEAREETARVQHIVGRMESVMNDEQLADATGPDS